MQTPSGYGWTIIITPIPTIELWMSFFSGSVPAEAAWRFDRLKIGDVGIADCLQGIGCCALTEVVRQCIEPGSILRLQLCQLSDGVAPAPRSAAVVGRAVHADCRLARGARGSAAGLAFGVGHGCFADRLARHGSTPKRDVTIGLAVGKAGKRVACPSVVAHLAGRFVSADLRR